MSTLLLQKEEAGLRAAVMQDGRLYAYRAQQDAAAVREGQIYLSVVDRAIKGVGAVFVRLPGGEFGFLPTPSGQRAPASGDRLIVQVKRPPSNVKKAFMTRDIALDGTYLILLPCSDSLGVSSRIEDAALRRTLREPGRALKPHGMGIVMRAAATDADMDMLKAELDALMQRWQSLQSAQAHGSAPRLLWDGEDMLTQLLREEGGRLDNVITNAPELLPQDFPCPVRTAEHPFMLHAVDHKLEKSRRRTVLLKSGASLVIDRCEAMTVIDVNSAMAPGGKGISQTAERVNLEAAAEIARLLRLLGIGGMVLIDFIDLDSDEARSRLLDVMREHLRQDPVKAEVIDITPLGIMELTRRRAQSPLSELPDIPCPHCCGTGCLDTPEEETPDA